MSATVTPRTYVLNIAPRTFLMNAVLLICSVAIALFITEAYFRWFNPQPIIPRYVETSPYGIRKNIGNVRGTMIVPEYRHAFTTNSQGFRGMKEYSLQKPPGVYRVIVLGDSVALGHGVEDSETFAAVLERELSKSRPTEVINMGVSGFGTAEELIQLQHVGWAYQPDLIVLTYFQNDPYNNVVSKLFAVENNTLIQSEKSFVPAIFIRDRLYSIPGYSWLCQRSHLMNFVRNRFSAIFTQKLARENRIGIETTDLLTPDEAQLTQFLLNAFIAETRSHRVPLMIVNVPLVAEGKLISNFSAEELQTDREWMMVVDMKKDVYETHPVTDLSYEKDAHPTPYGHRLIGERLAEVIQSRFMGNER
jgi:lysophospholipase L1-like esterase